MYKSCRYWFLILPVCFIAVCGVAQDSSGYENDTTETSDAGKDNQHIYDTSKNFFKWKEDVNDPYTAEKIPPHAEATGEVNKLKEEDAFWYVKSVEKFRSSRASVQYEQAVADSLSKQGKGRSNPEEFSEEEPAFSQLPGWANILIWGVIITVFVLAVAYFLFANKINIFSRRAASSEGAANDESADLFSLPYTEMLQKAYADKNYRLAVRILYLQTLKLLSEKNIIRFQADYTNMHYLQQLSPTMFYKDFFAITRHYEYVWYGEFAVSEQAFATIRNDFNTIQHKVLQQ